MAKNLAASLWIKLTLPGGGQIGPGKIELLRAIEAERSIAAAARRMQMSYRRAWLLVDELNHSLAAAVVTKWQGGQSKGGASLTPAGRDLLRAYDELVRRCGEAGREQLAAIGQSAGRRAKARSR
jgi:molybdate transport system regulatory protein